MTDATLVGRIVDRLFAGRKGHGGGPCTFMKMSRNDLTEILQAVYDAGFKDGKASTTPTPEASDE